MMHIFSFRVVFIAVALLLSATLFGQGTQVDFGKNRVQYHDYDWEQYESANYTVYWYGTGQNIAKAALRMAEDDYDEIQEIMEDRVSGQIEIIVYTDLTDLKQSNIGSEEVFFNTGGVTKIVGKKIFVYFNGDHNDLRRQIREGVARIYLRKLLFGGNLQQVVQNAVLMNLPEWFTEGIVSYVGENWNTELDDQLRDGILSGRYTSFYDAIEDNPTLAGHSMWHYISTRDGNASVSNVLYITRINRTVNSGFLYVLGNSYEQVAQEWFVFYQSIYKADIEGLEKMSKSKEVVIKNKRSLPVTEMSLSPNGRQIVYAVNELGKYSVYLQDVGSEKRKRIFKLGHKNVFQAADYNYPKLAWTPNGREVAIVYEKQDKVKLQKYDVDSGKKNTDAIPDRYERIIDIDFLDNNRLAMAVISNGISNAVIYNTRTRGGTTITKDIYDVLDVAAFRVGEKKGVLFTSNRPSAAKSFAKLDTIAPEGQFDLYYYEVESKEITQITNTPLANESAPVQVDSVSFAYASDQSGIASRSIGRFEQQQVGTNRIVKFVDGSQLVNPADSVIALADQTLIDTFLLEPVYGIRATTYQQSAAHRGLLQQSSSRRTSKIAEMYFLNGRNRVFVTTPDISKPLESIRPSAYRMFIEGQAEKAAPVVIDSMPQGAIEEPRPRGVIEPESSGEPADSNIIDIDNYIFQSDFEEPEDAAVINEQPDGTITLEKPVSATDVSPLRVDTFKWRSSNVLPYRTTFKTDYITTQLDNSILFEGIESYGAGGEFYGFPTPSILLRGSVIDLFEDYRLTGGIRVPISFNGVDYFLQFEDRKKRLDKEYAFFRSSRKNSFESGSFFPFTIKSVTTLGQVKLKYPLDIYRSIRLRAQLRGDQAVPLATDFPFLNEQIFSQERVGLRLEYVFDNTIDVSMNIKHGTRYKVFYEVQKRFDLDVFDGVNLDINPGQLNIISADFRHYQRLDKRSILALRAAGATSFGSEKMLYFLGGVDNWLLPEFNEEVTVPFDQSFAYQTLASNLRGFKNNIRNGNSYALVNAELRVPLFTYLSKRPLKSSILQNFQAVGFFDIGTAWQGVNPFSDENPLNSVTFGQPPIEVNVNYFRNPIVYGYGFGVRTMLFGYFVRADYAWGVETGDTKDPRLYISIGRDF